jgi:NitT/TauT family transport system permease protein
MAGNGTLWHNASATLSTALWGFVLGLAIGFILGFAVGLAPSIAETVNPFITVFNAMPRITLAPLFVIWFGIGSKSGIALVFSLVFFIAIINAISGAQSVDANLVTLARLYGASKWTQVRKLILPSTTPWLFVAARISLAYALSGAVVSEMFFGQQGLGYLMVSASGVFDTPTIFASILFLLISAWILDLLINGLEKRILRWRPEALG